MSIILDVYGREVLDSRGNPTVEVEAHFTLKPMQLIGQQHGCTPKIPRSIIIKFLI